MTMIKFNDTVTEAYDSFLEDLKYELEYKFTKEDDTDEIYFHDIMHQVVDNAVSNNDRNENLKVIDDTGHENIIDTGLVDHNADITMQIAQTAYACLEQELFNDDFIQELQTALNNENIDYEKAQELIAEIKERLE